MMENRTSYTQPGRTTGNGRNYVTNQNCDSLLGQDPRDISFHWEIYKTLCSVMTNCRPTTATVSLIVKRMMHCAYIRPDYGEAIRYLRYALQCGASKAGITLDPRVMNAVRADLDEECLVQEKYQQIVEGRTAGKLDCGIFRLVRSEEDLRYVFTRYGIEIKSMNLALGWANEALRSPYKWMECRNCRLDDLEKYANSQKEAREKCGCNPWAFMEKEVPVPKMDDKEMEEMRQKLTTRKALVDEIAMKLERSISLGVERIAPSYRGGILLHQIGSTAFGHWSVDSDCDVVIAEEEFPSLAALLELARMYKWSVIPKFNDLLIRIPNSPMYEGVSFDVQIRKAFVVKSFEDAIKVAKAEYDIDKHIVWLQRRAILKKTCTPITEGQFKSFRYEYYLATAMGEKTASAALLTTPPTTPRSTTRYGKEVCDGKDSGKEQKE